MSRYATLKMTCDCGGAVVRLFDDTSVILTDEQELVILGICNQCGTRIDWCKKLTLLMVMCPSKQDERGH